MPDYQLGKIYKLTCADKDMVYYGSTCNYYLANRLSNHHQTYKKNKNCSSKELYEKGEVKIELCENYPCNSKKELLERERWWIENNKCVNKIFPITSPEQTKAKQKKYREENRDILLKKKREYTRTHKNEKKEYDKLRYQQKKEEIKNRVTQRYQEKKEEIKEYARNYYYKRRDNRT